MDHPAHSRDTLSALIARDAARIAYALGLPLDEAAGEVRVLLGRALGRSRAWLMAHERDRLDLPADALAIHADWLTRRCAGEPVAYLLGHREFYGRDFRVGPEVLIPRPETELLVDTVLQHLPQARSCKVLDLGTGSGCIAISVALEAPRAKVLALDASEDALTMALRNAQALDAGNVHLLHSDWYGDLWNQKFDVIVSNPPYVAMDDMHLSRGDLRFEPRRALTPGNTGMEAIARIAEGAGAFLRPGGWLMLEHGHDQGNAVRQCLRQQGFVQPATLADIAGQDRVTFAQWGAAAPMPSFVDDDGEMTDGPKFRP